MAECERCGAAEDVVEHRTGTEPGEAVAMCLGCLDELHPGGPPEPGRPDCLVTIPVSESTRAELSRRASGTWDEIIERLLEEAGDGPP